MTKALYFVNEDKIVHSLGLPINLAEQIKAALEENSHERAMDLMLTSEDWMEYDA